MEIEVRAWGYSNIYYEVYVSSGGCSIREDFLSQSDVNDLSVEFLLKTLLARCSRHEIIDQLISYQVIDEEMIQDWVLDNNQEDNM